VPSDYVRVLGVTISSDLCLDKHVSMICATCFFWHRQLRRVRRSLDTESVRTLVHAFITSSIDDALLRKTNLPTLAKWLWSLEILLNML